MKYLVVPWFWGAPYSRPANDSTWPSTPYTPQQLSDGLLSIRRAGYFSRLAQYGADDVHIQNATSFPDPWPAGNTYYVARFTLDDVLNFLTRHLPSFDIPVSGPPKLRPTAENIFLVVLPHGSLLDVKDNGAHSVMTYKRQNIIYAWMYAMNELAAATRIATHEIVESIGANGNAPKELCDDCEKSIPNGVQMPDGLIAEAYFDQEKGRCVGPGNIENWRRPLGLSPGTLPRP